MTALMTVVKRANDGTKSSKPRTRRKILVNKTHRFVGSPRLRDNFE
jgi:hypothetical protein